MSVCDPLTISVAEENGLQYGDSGRSFLKDSIFACLENKSKNNL